MIASLAAGAVLCLAQGAMAQSESNAAWKAYEQRLAEANRRNMTSKPSGPESRTRDALVAMYSGDRRRLQELYYQTRAEEDTAGDRRELRQSDSILYLFNQTLPDRDQMLAGHEAAARETQSDELRTRILLSMLDDEYYEINQLKGQNRFNKFTRVFNRASSSLSKLAMFQPQDAAQLLLDAAYSFRKAKSATDKERRIIYLCNAFLAKYPQAAEAPEVGELLAQLRTRLAADWAQREKVTGKLYLEKQSYTPAEFHLETAALLAPDDEESSKLLQEVRMSAKVAEAGRMVSLDVSGAEQHYSWAEQAAHASAVRAVMQGDTKTLAAVAGRAPSLASHAEYAISACLDAKGKRSEAIERLTALAQSQTPAGGNTAAAALLRNPSYNLDFAFTQAVERMERERKRFVLTGKRTADENAYVFGSAAIQSAGQAAAGVPLLFLTDMLVRGVAEQFKTQVATDAAVDAAARFKRRYPDSPRGREMAYEMAQLSKRASEPERAEEFLAESGASDPKLEGKLREDRARQLHKQAMDSGDLSERKELLEKVAREYADCKIAGESAKQLAKLPPGLTGKSIVLIRKMLESDPEFAVSIGIPAELVDGKKSNGELADQGIAINPETGVFEYLMRGEDAYRASELPRNDRRGLLARARTLHDKYAFETSGKTTLQRRILPLEIQGGAGGSGVEVSPRLLPYKSDEEREKYFR